MTTTNDFIKYKKITAGTGVTVLFGAVLYQYICLKKTLNSLINPNVFDINTKHPDYIYVKYHIYRESMLRQKHEELADKKWVNVIVHPVGKWWKAIKHSIAWRLLEVAKNGDYHDRLKAVRQLACIDHLKDWDYQHLAQMCDARTAISLARNFSDVRWFLSPHSFGSLREPKSLISDINNHFSHLKTCKCLSNFYVNVFDNFSILNGYEYTIQSTSKGRAVSRQEYECIRKCLEALYHMTHTADSAETLIKSGILSTLIEILKLFHNDLNLRFLLAKIIANLSVCHSQSNDFFVSGWVGVLARWTRNPDIRIQVTAAKALANMDVDDRYQNEYLAKVYPLYPLMRSHQKQQLDIVFVHGLLGGVFVTWRQKDPKEPDLGLYGKNTKSFDIAECNDIYLVGIGDDNSIDDNYSNNIHFERKRRSNIANNRIILNSFRKNELKTITYSDSPLIGTKAESQTETSISDLATKELIETLNTATELESEWEVVFPDCPQKATENAKGSFSISGDKWINDDQNGEYTFCWPMDWLPQEYPNIRIIGLNYETSISEWSLNLMCPCDKTKSSLHDRAEEFLHSLTVSKVGRDCPVIWVGHSMGGLVAKSIIVQALESTEPNVRLIGENTRAILFLGTPHKGSPVAKLKQHIQMIFSPTIEVKELRENSQLLLHLHEKFEQMLKTLKKPIEIVSIAEGCPTIITSFKFPLKFVNEESAKLNVGDFYVLNVDHLGLSKPIFRQSFLYQRLLKIINDVVINVNKERDEAEQLRNIENIYEKLNRDHDCIL